MKAFVIGLSIMMAAAGSRGNAGSGTCAAGAGIYAAGFDAGRLAGFVPAILMNRIILRRKAPEFSILKSLS